MSVKFHSQRHINVSAFVNGYLQAVSVKEGQAVKKGDPMFKILPTLYAARRDAEQAEVTLVGLEFKNTQKLFEDKVVSQQEVALHQAKLAKAQANANLATAELNFTADHSSVRRHRRPPGTAIREPDQGGGRPHQLVRQPRDVGVFQRPRGPLPRIHGRPGTGEEAQKIELVLANGNKFPQIGTIGAIEANFNSETGNIPFRADFPNPVGLLRHGQTGNVLIHQTLKDALVIPQRATFEILDKRYVYVVDKENVVRQREIAVQNELCS